MPSVSKAQQRFMGMVHATQKGSMAAPSPEIAEVAKDMKSSDVNHFAKTKRKGLPEHVKKNKHMKKAFINGFVSRANQNGLSAEDSIQILKNSSFNSVLEDLKD